MMERTLFSVLLPATGSSYDFWVPRDMQMQTAAGLVAEAMQLAEPEFYRASPDAALMFAQTGEIQDPSATVAEIGFTDGARFVLV